MLNVRPKLFYMRNQINLDRSDCAQPKQSCPGLRAERCGPIRDAHALQFEWFSSAPEAAGSARCRQDAINRAACCNVWKSVADGKTYLLQKKRAVFNWNLMWLRKVNELLKRIGEVFLVMTREIFYVCVSHLFQLDGTDNVSILLKTFGSEYGQFETGLHHLVAVWPIQASVSLNVKMGNDKSPYFTE